MKTSTDALAVPKTDITLDRNQLRQILQLSHAVNGSMSPAYLVQQMARAMEEIVPCMCCYVWVYDSASGEMWSYRDNVRLQTQADRILSGRAFLEKQQLHLSHPEEDSLLHEEYDRLDGARVGHYLAHPLFDAQGNALGVMQLMNSAIHPFSGSVMDMLGEWALLAGGRLRAVLELHQWQQAFYSFSDVLSETLDTRDYITSGHSRRVTLYAMEVAQQMNLNVGQRRRLQLAALLHDIGKLGIPELILLQKKRPGEDEYEIIRRHAQITRQILSRIQFPDRLREVVDIAAMHHEKLDGSGYPAGRRGDEIPLGAKILAVCDVFDALTSRRPYADRRPLEEVMEILEKETGSAFEPFIVYHFKNMPLSRLIQILEYGHTEHFDGEDLRRLDDHTLNDLARADGIATPVLEEIKQIFNHYYTRAYRG